MIYPLSKISKITVEELALMFVCSNCHLSFSVVHGIEMRKIRVEGLNILRKTDQIEIWRNEDKNIIFSFLCPIKDFFTSLVDHGRKCSCSNLAVHRWSAGPDSVFSFSTVVITWVSDIVCCPARNTVCISIMQITDLYDDNEGGWVFDKKKRFHFHRFYIRRQSKNSPCNSVIHM